jgi:hypothetical protein
MQTGQPIRLRAILEPTTAPVPDSDIRGGFACVYPL